ncbi:sugar ABC transporter substrate-binding protein [Mesorhizobium sp. CN2-181]|uniref:sugar ABC transporter substrate-binding protein n=1 Tax=Mesorhizobium yinganensis TaxID=3157707 RepID=UPI0032B88144
MKIASIATFGICLIASAAAHAETKVGVVAGGPHPYFASWPLAAADAAKDFGVITDYRVPQAWDLNQQNQLIESMVAQGFNGMLVFANDADGTNATLKDLADDGIPSIALGACTNDPTPALLCLTTDSYASAYDMTKRLIAEMGGKGNIVHVAGALIDPNTQLRVKAVEEAVSETNGAVTLIQTLADIDEQGAADRTINGYLGGNAAKVDGIIATAWIPAVVAATSLRNIGDRRIKMIGFNDDPIVVSAVKDGYLFGTMLQNPYGQVYLGTYILSKLANGCTLKDDAAWIASPQTKHFIDSGSAYVDASNIDQATGKQRAATKAVLATFDEKYLSCP